MRVQNHCSVLVRIIMQEFLDSDMKLKRKNRKEVHYDVIQLKNKTGVCIWCCHMIEKTTDQWCNIRWKFESPKDIYASMIITLYKFLLPIYSNTQTSSRIWQKVSEGITLILEIAKFLLTRVGQIKGSYAYAYQNQLDPSCRFGTIPACHVTGRQR